MLHIPLQLNGLSVPMCGILRIPNISHALPYSKKDVQYSVFDLNEVLHMDN